VTFEQAGRPSKKHTEIAHLESQIHARLEELPADIRRTWQARLDDTADEDLQSYEESLSTFLEKRQQVLNSSAPELFRGMQHLIKDEDAIQKTLEVVREAEGDPRLFVGEGKTAHVYRDPHTKALCYKYVHNFQEYGAWNNIDKEARYLEDLEDLVVDGARVPRLTGVIDLPDSKVIAMEYLNAASIDRMIHRGRAFPADFDIATFFKKLRMYISAMHERGVYHRDLHEGNILVGPDSTPYVIDFGRAVHSVAPEYAYEVYDRAGVNRIVLPSDEAWIDALEAKTRQAYGAQHQAKLANK
jgi:tRNA A-37 threonylcarbamoyl transferase component Bud32